MSLLLNRSSSQILVIDVQAKLVPAMAEFAPVESNCARLIQAAKRLSVPLTVTEQYPAGLGRTIASLLADVSPSAILEKVTFSAAADQGILDRLHSHDRKQVIVTGIEAHVCVLQTACGLKAEGFDVYVVLDAVTSRASSSVTIASQRLQNAGVVLVNTEMVMFEWLERAATAEFKSMRDLIV